MRLSFQIILINKFFATGKLSKRMPKKQGAHHELVSQVTENDTMARYVLRQMLDIF